MVSSNYVCMRLYADWIGFYEKKSRLISYKQFSAPPVAVEDPFFTHHKWRFPNVMGVPPNHRWMVDEIMKIPSITQETSGVMNSLNRLVNLFCGSVFSGPWCLLRNWNYLRSQILGQISQLANFTESLAAVFTLRTSQPQWKFHVQPLRGHEERKRTTRTTRAGRNSSSMCASSKRRSEGGKDGASRENLVDEGGLRVMLGMGYHGCELTWGGGVFWTWGRPGRPKVSRIISVCPMKRAILRYISTCSDQSK